MNRTDLVAQPGMIEAFAPIYARWGHVEGVMRYLDQRRNQLAQELAAGAEAPTMGGLLEDVNMVMANTARKDPASAQGRQILDTFDAVIANKAYFFPEEEVQLKHLREQIAEQRGTLAAAHAGVPAASVNIQQLLQLSASPAAAA